MERHWLGFTLRSTVYGIMELLFHFEPGISVVLVPGNIVVSLFGHLILSSGVHDRWRCPDFRASELVYQEIHVPLTDAPGLYDCIIQIRRMICKSRLSSRL